MKDWTPNEIERFAAFIGRPVAEAAAILVREAQDEATYGRQDVHDGYDYAAQAWA